MSYITRNLKQTATYWAPSSNDGFGNTTFSTPTTLNCRWEDRSELFIDSEGKEVRSIARVYVDADVTVGGYLYLGSSVSATPISGSYLIRDFRKMPNLAATEFERRVML